MKNRFFADPYKLAAAAGTILVFLLLCLWNVLRGDLFGFFFLLPALPFIYVAYLYGTMVEVREDQLMIRRPGKAVRSLPWTEIAEMGVIGTKVFNRSNPEKTGALYIYFSLGCLLPLNYFYNEFFFFLLNYYYVYLKALNYFLRKKYIHFCHWKY